jgi:hypothetical protein
MVSARKRTSRLPGLSSSFSVAGACTIDKQGWNFTKMVQDGEPMAEDQSHAHKAVSTPPPFHSSAGLLLLEHVIP